VIQQSGVTTVIPEGRTVEQVRANAAAAAVPALSDDLLRDFGNLYDRRIRPLVHDRW
jgi:aryl-alcohol dehydrogenase-like predicted oxidoreductase